MTAEQVDLSGMSRGQRVALMERIWRSLDEEPRNAEPPSWHEEVLVARQQEWDERDKLAEDWSKVKRELRKEFQ